MSSKRMYPVVKRFFDCGFSALGIMFLGPFLLFVGTLIFLIDGRPVLFRQERVGKDGRPFKLVKFRTMHDSSGSNASTMSPSVTKLGGHLRRSSVDELPSLWNVFRGDLSFVGPRPLLPEYLGVYSARHASRHSIRPGLTGHAQVSGRNLLSWFERLECDVDYIERQSFWFDAGILLRTVAVVFRASGINRADGSAMTPLAEGYDRATQGDS